MTLALEYVPRKKIVEALRSGLRLLPDVDYQEMDWAILMFRPTIDTTMPQETINRIAAWFALPQPPKPKATHCKNGHYLLNGNAYVRIDGYRGCKKCRRINQAKYAPKRDRSKEREKAREKYRAARFVSEPA